MLKAKPWEATAVDIVYNDRDPITIKILPRDYPDIEGWLTDNVKRPAIGEKGFLIYTYKVTLH